MTWLIWRQFRTQAWIAIAFLTVVAVALAVTGPNLAHLYNTSGLAACRADCDELASNFLNQVSNGATGSLYWIGIGVMFVAPVIIGIFWGAPLIARELEAGTYRLAWNQSVTRTRWLAAKLLGVGLAAMTGAGLLSLALTWWARPIDTAYLNRMLPEVFAARGIAPIGYAAFAFVVGVTAGMLTRRTVPAMAITLVVVAAALVVTPFYIRPHLMPPTHVTVPLESIRSLHATDDQITVIGKVHLPGAWIFSNDTITSTGELFTGPPNPQACGPAASGKTCEEWLATLQLRQQVAYQPADRYWALQWAETALLLALAAGLAGLCFWWLRRRLT